MRTQMQLIEKAPDYSSLGILTRAPCSGCTEGERLCRSAAVWELPGAFLQPGALSDGGVVPLQRNVWRGRGDALSGLRGCQAAARTCQHMPEPDSTCCSARLQHSALRWAHLAGRQVPSQTQILRNLQSVQRISVACAFNHILCPGPSQEVEAFSPLGR